MFRAAVSLMIIVSMVFAFSAYLASFKIRQFEVRKEIKHLIKSGAPDSLRFDFYLDELENNFSKVTWIHSKEFRYKGEMYDILDWKKEKGRIVLKCIHDVKESGLFAELDRMVELQMERNDQQEQHRNQWFKLFNSLFVLLSEDINWNPGNVSSKHYTPYIYPALSCEIIPNTPPPRLLS